MCVSLGNLFIYFNYYYRLLGLENLDQRNSDCFISILPEEEGAQTETAKRRKETFRFSRVGGSFRRVILSAPESTFFVIQETHFSIKELNSLTNWLVWISMWSPRVAAESNGKVSSRFRAAFAASNRCEKHCNLCFETVYKSELLRLID